MYLLSLHTDLHTSLLLLLLLSLLLLLLSLLCFAFFGSAYTIHTKFHPGTSGM